MLRMGIIVLHAVVWGAVGYVLAMQGYLTYYRPDARIPAPHVVPKTAGGTAMSLVMVRDLLHERFFKHSAAYYEKRNELSLAAMAKEDVTIADGDPTHGYLAHMDDLSVGYDMLHLPDKAIEVQRRKHELIRPWEEEWNDTYENADKESLKTRTIDDLSPEQLSLYRTYANLGTHLIHGAFKQGVMNDPAMQAQFREGVEFIRKSIEVNPEAHFQRENWQLAVATWLLSVMDNPQLLTKYDMVGNRLLEDAPPTNTPHTDQWSRVYLSLGMSGELVSRLRGHRLGGSVYVSPDGIAPAERLTQREAIRQFGVTRVGAEGDWQQEVKNATNKPAPFDEPALGLMGMWMIGGGANPHSAMALGGIIERVGQYETAWHGYQRALAIPLEKENAHKRFLGDDAIREQLRQYCRNRQTWLEQRLAAEENSDAAAIRERLLSDYRTRKSEADIYLQRLHQYEADRIQAGEDIQSDKFYDEFFQSHGRITTPVEVVDSVPLALSGRFRLLNTLPAVLLLAGLGALLGVFVSRRFAR